MFSNLSPTVTLSALVSNNTSAADSFAGWPNGNTKPSNVSKEPEHFTNPNLIKLVHRCDWWGGTNHPNIGINSHDPVYMAKTVADMKERGLNGAILDWYGKGSYEDGSALALKVEAEKQGFKFLICIDGGAIKNASDPTAAMIAQLDYIHSTYFGSPSYVTYQGRPVVLFFGASVNWTTVRSHVDAYAVHPLLFFRWEEGYSGRAEADGYYGWLDGSAKWYTDMLTKNKLVMGSVNAGFDNTVTGAPVFDTWGTKKVIAQDGGLRLKTQIDTLNQFPQVPFVQFVTWNDYQEGTEMETGIAGPSVSASFSNGSLNWVLNGHPEVVKRFEIYASADGVNLQRLDFVSTGSAYNIGAVFGALALAPGNYTLYVRAVCINSVQNAMSNPVPVMVAYTVC